MKLSAFCICLFICIPIRLFAFAGESDQGYFSVMIPEPVSQLDNEFFPVERPDPDSLSVHSEVLPVVNSLLWTSEEYSADRRELSRLEKSSRGQKNDLTMHSSGSLASTELPPLEISFWGHHGYLAPHHRSMAFYTTDNINGGEVFVSGFFPHVVTRRPTSFGAGYYYSNLGNREVYGRVHGLYTAIEVDFCRSGLPFYFKQTTSFGLSYNTERFDVHDNYANRAIGSHLNAFVIVAVDVVAEINDRLTLRAGPAAVHTSNGNIRHPNFGLNLLNARAGFSYRLKPPSNYPAGQSNEDHDAEQPPYRYGYNAPPKPSPFEAHRLQVISSGGIRQLSHKIRKNFFVGSVMADYSYRLNRYQAWGGGIDFVWDPTEGRETYVTEKRVENIVPWHLGVHLTWERIWNRFSMVLQPGYKVLTLSKHSFMQYNRAAIRYRPAEHMILSIAIKAQELRADFIEFGVGVELGGRKGY